MITWPGMENTSLVGSLGRKYSSLGPKVSQNIYFIKDYLEIYEICIFKTLGFIQILRNTKLLIWKISLRQFLLNILFPT